MKRRCIRRVTVGTLMRLISQHDPQAHQVVRAGGYRAPHPALPSYVFVHYTRKEPTPWT